MIQKTIKPKSATSFVRAQLGFKGATEHSGRGCYLCYVDTTWEDFVRKVDTKLDTWREKDLVEKSEISILEDKLVVVFKDGPFEKYYRTLVATRTLIETCGWYTINF